MKRPTLTLLLAAAMTLVIHAAPAASKPKITMAQARAIALKQAPGNVKSAELETEHGRRIYSFDIATARNTITEVNVDAMTGKVVAVQQESAAKEAAEKRREKQ